MRYITFVCGLLAIATAAAQDAGDTLQTAESTRISNNRGVKEVLSSATDVDFFTFQLREDRQNPEHDTSGNLTVTFSQEAPPGINPNSGWRIELFSEKDLANSLYTAILPETSLEVEFEQGLSPDTYYYKISSIDPVVFPAAEYTLQGSWEESSYYEKPFNDDTDNASSIIVNGAYHGNLSSANDVDFYRFGLQNPDLVTITLSQERPGADSTIGWQLSLLSPSLPQQEVINVPLTSLQNTLQVNLDVGTHYVFVKPLPQNDQEEGETSEKPDNKKAPIGRRYQIKVEAPTVPLPPLVDECPFIFTYAQHPVTQRWVAIPTPCDVPPGWFSEPVPPANFEVCPSPHATYTPPKVLEDGTPQEGKLTIPLVDMKNANGEVGSIWRADLEELPGSDPIQFQILLEELRLIRVEETTEEIVEEETPEEEVPNEVSTPVEASPSSEVLAPVADASVTP